MAVDSENRQDVADLMKKSGIGSVGQFIAIVLRYGATLIMTNILGAAPYGLFVLGRTVALFGGLLSTVGMGPAVRKQIPTYLVKGDHDRIRLSIRFSLLLTLSCSLGTMVLLFLLAPTLAYHAFDNPDLVPVIRLFAFVVPLTSVLDIYLDIFKGYKQIAAFVWVKNLALPGLNILFLLLAGWTGGSVTSFILAFVGAHVASLLLSIVLRKKHPAAVVEPAAAPAEANTEPVKEEMLRFGLPLFFTSALDYVQRWTDTVMLAWLLGMTATGIYGVSLRMAAFVALPLMAMNLIFSPLIAEVHARNDIERLRFNYQFVTKMVFSVSLFIFAIIFLFPHELLSMFGKEFSKGETVLVVICLGQLIKASMGATGQLLIMTGYVVTHFINSVTFIIVTIGLNLFLIPRYGILGAGIANAITLGALNLVRIAQVYRYLNIQPFRLDYFKPILAFAVAAGSVVFLRDWLAWNSGWSTVLFALLFCAIHLTVLILSGFSPEEKMIFSMVKKKLTKRLS